MTEKVILVNREDDAIGEMEKLEAHKMGLLHRAFSVFVYNTSGDLLLQQRQAGKYHSPGKWSNTCCGHPRPGEAVLQAAERRLNEEMGLRCSLHYIFKFTYFAKVAPDLSEHEVDHVFFGVCDELPKLNPQEASACIYTPMDILKKDLEVRPHHYTDWLSICFNRVYSLYKLFKS